MTQQRADRARLRGHSAGTMRAPQPWTWSSHGSLLRRLARHCHRVALVACTPAGRVALPPDADALDTSDDAARARCGDGRCQRRESCSSCAVDCGVCEEPRSAPAIAVSATSVEPGSKVVVTVTDGPGSIYERVDLNPTGTANCEGVPGAWFYLNGTTTPPSAPYPSGTELTFTMPATSGTYELRYFGADGCASLIATSVTVTVVGPPDTNDDPTSPSSCTHYASPTGGGDGLSAATPFTLSRFWDVAAPGATLCLLDGVYVGAANMLDPPAGLNGAPDRPITVRALNDGEVLFDGQFAVTPVQLENNSWWRIEGVNAKNGDYHVVALRPSVAYDPSFGSHHNVLRRVVAWDAHIAKNNAVFLIFDSHDNLVEDVAIFGTGHIGIENFGHGATGNVFRRVWSRFEGTITQGFQSAYYLAYGTGAGATCENCLASHTAESQPEEYDLTDQAGNVQSPVRHFTSFGGFRSGPLETQSDRSVGPCAGTKIFGSLSYLVDSPGSSEPYWMVAARGDVCATLRHVYAYVSPTHPKVHDIWGFILGDSDYGITPETFSASNLTSVRSDVKRDYFFPGWSVSNVSAGASAAEVASPWTTAGSGANLCNRWVDGAVTDEPLWPWPMNERIRRATASAGAYAGPCPTCVGGRRVRVATDVTSDVERMLGAIPSQCRR
jgi:hypothetical protein